MMYFSTVKAIAQACILNGSVSSGIWPVLGSTPKTSPVKRRITPVLGQLIHAHPECQEEDCQHRCKGHGQ